MVIRTQEEKMGCGAMAVGRKMAGLGKRVARRVQRVGERDGGGGGLKERKFRQRDCDRDSRWSRPSGEASQFVKERKTVSHGSREDTTVRQVQSESHMFWD